MRPKKGATVSTPLDWGEVKEGLDPKSFNIHTIAKRIKGKGDLFAPILDKSKVIDLGKCLENLSGN
jgi:bifunctional non-homologous end joining protein LigD